MTDMWQDPDFFSMTDEAWASYQARMLRGPDPEDVRKSPSDRQGPPKGLYPTGEPLIQRSPALRPLTDGEAELDFEAGCQTGDCDWPARFYLEFHPCGRCTHPVYAADDGLQKLLVCELHLQGFERRAELIAAELNAKSWWRIFRDDKPGVCSTCGQAIQHAGDVLSVVREVR